MAKASSASSANGYREANTGGRGIISAEFWQADGLVARVPQTLLVMASG